MLKSSFISVMCGLVLAVWNGGPVIAEERTPVPALSPIEQPQALPGSPPVQTFAIGGAATECGCQNVVSVAQAREGQAYTVISSTGSWTFTACENDIAIALLSVLTITGRPTRCAATSISRVYMASLCGSRWITLARVASRPCRSFMTV
jgi:hypothetical protein